MLKFEAILIDPSPGEIAERLADAAAAANKRCRTRLLADDPAKWRKFARQTQASAEGFDLWRGGRGGVPGTQVVGAWWTDHIGRKHVVLRSRRVEHDASRVLLHKDELARRPPLWHCYPEYVYQRLLPAADWIAVCGCGATGTPEALGWMGETCGPCHDRLEERGEPRDNPGWLHGVRNPFVAVAFSRDGSKLAAAEEDGPIGVWNLNAGGDVLRLDPMAEFDRSANYLAFSGRSDELLFASSPVGHHDRPHVTAYELHRPAGPRAHPLSGPGVMHDEDSPGVLGPTRSPDRTISFINSVLELRGTFPRFERLRSEVVRHGLWPHPPVTPSPTHVLVLATDGVHVFASESLDHIAFAPYRPHPGSEHHLYHRHRAAYHAPTQMLLIARHDELEVYDVRERRYGKVVRPGTVGGRRATIRELALSADGRHLFAVVWDRVVVLDAVTLATVAAFAWHVGPIACLAVSPDGRTLATAGVEGVVKLWPINRLLAAAN